MRFFGYKKFFADVQMFAIVQGFMRNYKQDDLMIFYAIIPQSSINKLDILENMFYGYCCNV
jgi:hypothetical protein